MNDDRDAEAVHAWVHNLVSSGVRTSSNELLGSLAGRGLAGGLAAAALAPIAEAGGRIIAHAIEGDDRAD